LNISGGNTNTTFRISAAYHKEKDVLAASGSNQRSTIQSSLTHRSLNNRLTISFNNILSYAEVDQIGYDPNLVLLPPNAPAVYDSAGNLNYKGYNPTSTLFGFGSLKERYLGTTLFLNNNLNVRYELLKGLRISTTLGNSNNRIKQFQSTPIASQNPISNPKGSAFFGNNNGNRWIIEPQAEYETIIKKLRANLIAGGTIQKVSQDGNTIIGRGYIDDNLLRSISNAPIKSAADVSGQYRYAAVFSRISLNYDGKYLLNLSARRDGSSRFGEGKQFGNFGSLGVAWIFSEENFFKKSLPFLSFGKIRGSFGVSGSDNIGDYTYLTRWTASSSQIDPYMGQVGYLTTQHVNPNLQWQENKKLELGLHLGFLMNRLSLEVSYYRDRCGNQLVDNILPSITGFSSISANLAANVQNSGIEGIIRATILQSKNFNWTANFNININRNKLLSYPNLENSPYASSYIIGKSLNIAKLLHHTGVDIQNGAYTFEDLNKDSIISFTGVDNDLYPTDLNKKYEGGFGSDFSFKKFTASFFMTFQKRPFVRGAIYNSAISPGGFGLGNQSIQMIDRWKKPGDIAKVQKYSTQITQTDTYFTISDGLFSNGSFLRMANISLSYDFQISKGNMKNNLKVFMRGENLFLITNYNGIDPLTPTFGGLPIPRTITAGLQLTL
jgi:TonB-linked SusC/RagA family outer membrane protein